MSEAASALWEMLEICAGGVVKAAEETECEGALVDDAAKALT